MGVWLIDADGRRYLDAYNNVPVVGHEHPRVVEAIVRQARRLNTNMRYLHETALEVAERLIASTGGALDVVMFVNSGSEANDIAWRIARAVDRRRAAASPPTGPTTASPRRSTRLTPEEWGSGRATGARSHLASARIPAGFRTRALESVSGAGGASARRPRSSTAS